MILPSPGLARIYSETIWGFVLGCFFVVGKTRVVLSTSLCKEPETFSQEQMLLNRSALDKQLGPLWPDPRSAGQFCMHGHIKIPLT